MSSRFLHIDLAETTNCGAFRRTFTFQNSMGTRRFQLFYESEQMTPVSFHPFDGVIFAVLLYAMRRGRSLRAHGPITRTALWNAMELQRAWARWRPGHYHPVEIVPDYIVDMARQKPGRATMAAFSGGVDASFTALQHSTLLPESYRYNLTALLMVHGFDISLGDAAGFSRLVARSDRFRAELAVNTRIIRTNSKELNLQNWEDSYAAQLAGCLHQFSDKCEFGLIASAEPYDKLALPLGSSPATDHLLSGDCLTIIHDGAGFSRTEKVEAIARYPNATAGLKVCWEGADPAVNCGVCEKCVRTRLNFLAIGEARPACFEGVLETRHITHVPLRRHLHCDELRSILEFARSHGCEGDWIEALEQRITAYEQPNPR
jgi:hypothetical protein